MDFRWLAAAVLVTCGMDAAIASEPKPSCTSIAPEMAEMLVDHWPAALAAGDAGRLGALYARDAVVISPAHPQARSTPADVAQHAAAMARTFKLARPALRTLRTGCGTILEFGEMRLKPREGGRQSELAVRYSRVYERRGGVWLLTLDHMTPLDGAGTAALPAQTNAQPPASDRDQLDALVRQVSGRRHVPQVAGMLIRPPQLAVRPAALVTPAAVPAPSAEPRKPRRAASGPDWRRNVFGMAN